MFAPQVMYYKECLSGNHGLNGTAVESDKAIKLLDKLFEILDPIEPMGTDDNGDGHITEDEISEMSGPPVSSDSFLMQEQFGDTDLYAAAEGMPDYVNDVPGDDMA